MLRYLIALVLLVLVGYGLREAVPIIAGPSLALRTPTDGMNVPGGILTVSGTTTRATALTLDGAPVLYDQNGSFSSTLTLPHGGSILTLKATDRFGRTVTETRTVFVP